jgi:hypothetical protein
MSESKKREFLNHVLTRQDNMEDPPSINQYEKPDLDPNESGADPQDAKLTILVDNVVDPDPHWFLSAGIWIQIKANPVKKFHVLF